MKDKKFLLWTSALTLLPIVAGLLLWNTLPDRMASHWGVDGAADGWASKGVVVFGLPAMMLAFQWLMLAATRLDKKNVSQNPKIMKVILLIFPVLSNVMAVMAYNAALGADVNISRMVFPLLGLLFLAIGNYMPKCRWNKTLGIKIKWTLANEENWNKTHRFAGRVWVVGGLVFLILSCLPTGWAMAAMVALMIVLVALPTVYSWRLYKKQVANGTWTVSKKYRLSRLGVAGAIVGIAIAAGALTVMFAGGIEPTLGEEALTIQASFWDDAAVAYADIDHIEYREDGIDGVREWGFGSAKLLIGTFRNDELGQYTRYTYTGNRPCIVIHSDGNVLVFGTDNADETHNLYQQLLEKIG